MISVGNYWNGILYEENKSFVVLLKFLQYQVAQSVTSIDNFLRLVPDPFHQDVYLQKNIFLPLLNNQTYNPYSEGNKTGITRLKKLVAIGGPDDGVITPWQSSHFGFYKTGSDTEIVDTKDQETYLTDSIGLRTLDEHGDFIVYNINGVHHTHWHQNKTVFDCCIKQWLT
jgi:palmitoyl-protein thioesterase